MYNIPSDLRFLIWIVVGVAGVLVLILVAYLESNFAHIVRKIFSPSSAGRPPKKTHPLAWLAFVFCVVITVLGTAIASTTPDNLPTPTPSSTQQQNLYQTAFTPTALTHKIGIVVGHWGNDTGTVCDDKNGQITLTEVDVNSRIATLVQQKLNALGFQSELFKEFDPRLATYNGDVVLSIHADSCQYINDNATGFKVSPAILRKVDTNTEKLIKCIIDNYQKTVGIPYHQSVTSDMSSYHGFDEVKDSIPVGVIETGFLNLDYQLLVDDPELVAEGITNGLSCYYSNIQVMDDFVFDLLGFGDTARQRMFIMNISGQTIDLTGWRVEDDSGNIFNEFKNQTILQNNNSLYIYSCPPPSEYDLCWPLSPKTIWKSKMMIRLVDNTNIVRAIEIIP